MSRNGRAARIASAACVVLAVTASIPWFADWNMMRVGFAWMTVAGAGAGLAAIAAVIFRARARQERDLVAQTGEFLAEWTVPPSLWRDVIARQFADEVDQKRSLLRVVWVACAVCAGGFLVFDPDAGRWVAAAMLLVAVATGLAATLTPRRRRRRLESCDTVVRVGRTSGMLGDELHTWRPRGSRLRRIQLRDHDDRSWLEVRYAFSTRAGMQEECVLLPVPRGDRETAAHIVDTLSRASRR